MVNCKVEVYDVHIHMLKTFIQLYIRRLKYRLPNLHRGVLRTQPLNLGNGNTYLITPETGALI